MALVRTFLTGSLSAETKRPVPLVFDTDIGNDVDDVVGALHPAADQHEPGAHDDGAVGFEYLGPDDGVADGELVLKGDENDAFGGARTLAHQDDAGDSDLVAILAVFELVVVGDTFLAAQMAQELHRVAFEGEFEGLVVVDDMFGHGHAWQADRFIMAGAAHAGSMEQRQRTGF